MRAQILAMVNLISVLRIKSQHRYR